ncbi:hypothetical protein [Amycolatopsis sp. lyj-108]|uniref:hypothetical protein n=1 Tax=Amycolatopsis sp. lyj-108 TaxID=2789286 RepID=UPI00397BF599
MFEQDVWNFSDATDLAAYIAKPHKRWNFGAIRNPVWRVVAKEYLVALLVPSHDAVCELPAAYRVARTVPGCVNKHYELIRWFNWLTNEGITELGQVSEHLCEVYIAERRRGNGKGLGDRRSTVNMAVQVINGLVQYHALFSNDRLRAGFRPFGGKAAAAVAGLKTPIENSTPVVPDDVLQPVLAAALYVVDALGPHVVALNRHMRAERARIRTLPEPRSPSMGLVRAAIEQRVVDGRPFSRIPHQVEQIVRRTPAHPDDPLANLSLRDVAIDAGFGNFRTEWLTQLRPVLERAAALVGVEEPLGRDAAEVARADGRGDVAWTVPLSDRHARALTDVVRTACLLVIAAATGMRSSELFELTLGCRLPPEEKAPGMWRYRLAGKVIKHRGYGGEADEWVVVAEVHRAVALAEQLLGDDAEPGALLFGRTSFKNTYGTFRRWVNGPAGDRLGLVPIPERKVELRMLRRTLAVEIAYRPGGLLAAKLALKHISVVTTEGYAGRPGGAQAKFLAEVGKEEQKRNLDILVDEMTNYRNGIRPSGPHAKNLLEFFDIVDGKLTDEQRAAPKIIVTDQELRGMLSKRAKTLHLGIANYCWFTDPSKALCLRLAGTPDADKPLIGMCDSARCPQATHHPCHRPVWAQAVESTTVFLGNLSRGQKAEKVRLGADLARANRVLAEIDANSGTASTDEV